VAAVRLERLKQESTPEIIVVWMAYPLLQGNMPGLRFDSYLADAWARAGQEEPTLTFRPWPESQNLPSSSLPALEAAKCAELQGRDVFGGYHMALFHAFFEQCRDISSREVLVSVAAEVGLDVARLGSDLDLGEGKSRVLADYSEIRRSGSLGGVPTAIFTEDLRLEGAVPIELYRRAVETVMKRQLSE